MVVRLAVTMCRRRSTWQMLPGVTALLAGIAIQPPQFGSVSLSSPGLQPRGIEGLLRQAQPRATLDGIFAPPAALPGLQLRGIEGLLWDSELRAFAELPWKTQLGAAPFGDFGLPGANGFTIGGGEAPGAAAAGWPNPSSSLVFGQGAIGSTEMQGFGSTISRLVDGSAGTDEFGVGRGPVPRARGAALGSIQIMCDAQLPAQLQVGGEFWSAQAVSAAPVQFPPREFTGNLLANPDSLGDPTLGPSGDRSNLSPPGPAGAWCRPPPVPFAYSSPLAGRVFWTPFALILAAMAVLWLSRGVRLPRL